MFYDCLQKMTKLLILLKPMIVKNVDENATMVGIPAKAVKVGNKGSFRPYGVDDKVKDE